MTSDSFILSGARSRQKFYSNPTWSLSINPIHNNYYRFSAVHYSGTKPSFYFYEVKAQELPYLLAKTLEELCYMTRTKHEEHLKALERSKPTPSAFSELTLSELGL